MNNGEVDYNRTGTSKLKKEKRKSMIISYNFIQGG